MFTFRIFCRFLIVVFSNCFSFSNYFNIFLIFLETDYTISRVTGCAHWLYLLVSYLVITPGSEGMFLWGYLMSIPREHECANRVVSPLSS